MQIKKINQYQLLALYDLKNILNDAIT